MPRSSSHSPTDSEILTQDEDTPTVSPKVLGSKNGCRVTRLGRQWMPARRRGILDGDTNVVGHFYAREETRLDDDCSKFTWQHPPATTELTPGLPHKAQYNA